MAGLEGVKDEFLTFFFVVVFKKDASALWSKMRLKFGFPPAYRVSTQHLDWTVL